MVSTHHGTANARAPSDTVVASIDPGQRRDQYVIADISVDDAWLSMDATGALQLEEWR